MANEMPQATTHDISSEAVFKCQEMEDVDDDGYDDCADSVDLGGMVDKMADEHHIDRDEAVKRLGRSTGRQRHLVPTRVSPLFDVVLLCCAVGGLLRRAIWV